VLSLEAPWRAARGSQNALISGDDPQWIVNPVALVAAPASADAAFFLAYLTSQAATKIFTGQGFDILSK
jgi:ABC-type molybdate transport system substrate-binding protein